MGWIYNVATKNVRGLVWKYVYNAYISGYSFLFSTKTDYFKTAHPCCIYINTVCIWLYCYPTNFPYSPHQNWHTILWDELSCNILIPVCIFCYQPLCHNCFNLVIKFKSMAIKILLQHWKRMTTAEHQFRAKAVGLMIVTHKGRHVTERIGNGTCPNKMLCTFFPQNTL